MAKRMLVARASRHVAIQRRVQGRIPDVPIFLKQVLSPGISRRSGEAVCGVE
jgi:hypothetical protein